MKNFRINFVAGTKFFFGDFHRGTINILLHIVSISVLIYGLVNKDLFLAILGIAFFDEIGHVYNYIFPHKKDPQYNPVRMLPYQILYVVPVGLVLFKVFDLI